jgi:hypothetical protein
MAPSSSSGWRTTDKLPTRINMKNRRTAGPANNAGFEPTTAVINLNLYKFGAKSKCSR